MLTETYKNIELHYEDDEIINVGENLTEEDIREIIAEIETAQNQIAELKTLIKKLR